MTYADAHDIRHAFQTCDTEKIINLFELDPVLTLRELDYEMRALGWRGVSHTAWQLLEEPIPPLPYVRWLAEQDRALRRRLGWAQQRQANLRILREAYQAGDLFLVIGAGISMAANMPGWKDLVAGFLSVALTYRERLIKQAISNDNGIVVIGDKVFMGPPGEAPAERVQWIRGVIEEHIAPLSPALRERIEQTRDALMASQNYDANLLLAATALAKEALGDGFHYTLRALLYHGRTLYRTKIHPAIVRMIRPKQEGSLGLTPRIPLIMTYNFDDLLEQEIREAGHGFSVILSKKGEQGTLWGGKRDVPSSVDIIHVHGFAPNSLEWLVFPSDETDLVFSEEQYSLQYGGQSSFVSRIHESLLTNAPSLIIGSSLTDSYAVNQLKKAHQNRPGWFKYCIMMIPEEFREKLEDMTGEQLEKISDNYRSMGLHVVWIKGHDDLPAVLDEIRVPVPKDPLRMAEIAYMNGDHEAAEKSLIEVYSCPRASFNLARVWKEKGDLPRASEAYRDTIDSAHPEWAAKAALNLGLMLERSGDVEGAKHTYIDAIAFADPKWSVQLHVAAGNLIERNGDHEAAESHYRHAISLSNEATNKATNLLKTFGAEAPYAQEYFSPTLDLSHLEYEHKAAYRLAIFMIEKGDLDEAEQLVRKLRLAGAKLLPAAALKVGILLQKAGRTDEAIKTLEASHSRHPDDRDTLLALVRLNRNDGRIDAAEAWAEKLMAVDSGFTDPV